MMIAFAVMQPKFFFYDLIEGTTQKFDLENLGFSGGPFVPFLVFLHFIALQLAVALISNLALWPSLSFLYPSSSIKWKPANERP